MLPGRQSRGTDSYTCIFHFVHAFKLPFHLRRCWKDKRKINIEVPQKYSQLRKFIPWVIGGGVGNMPPFPCHPSTESKFRPLALQVLQIFSLLKIHTEWPDPFLTPGGIYCLDSEPATSHAANLRDEGGNCRHPCVCPVGRRCTCSGSECRMNEWVCPEAPSLPGIALGFQLFQEWFSSSTSTTIACLTQDTVNESCYYNESANRWEPFVAGEAWINSLHIRKDSLFIPPQNGLRTNCALKK